MRNLVVLLLLFCSMLTLAQNKKKTKEEKALESVEIIDGKMLGIVPWKDGGPYYSEVIEADGTKDELYTRARTWFAETFNDSRGVIQMDDKDAGIIIGKGKFIYTDNGATHFTIKIQVKDGRYKYDIFDLNEEVVMPYYSGRVLVSKTFNYTPYQLFYSKKGKKNLDYAEALDLRMNKVVSKLVDSMNMEGVSSGDDSDW